MTQERMHPEDARRETALELYALYIATGTDDPSHKAAIQEADEFLAELARTAKPEAPKDIKDVLAPFGRQPWHCEYCGMVVDGGTYHDCKENTLKARAEQAEARVKELEAKEGLISDEVLDQLQSARDRIHELEEAIKKHRSIVKGSHHWRGCDWDKDLLAKVNP